MIINILSDLHSIEKRKFTDIKSDLAIIAGDTAETPVNVMEFGKSAVPNAKYIVQVPGNHDYIGHTYDEGLTIMKSQETEHHKILENDTWIIDGEIPIRLIGGTLWTDFNLDKNSKKFMDEHRNIIEDFKRIKNFTPEEWVKRHKITKEFFLDTLETHFNGISIIIHHHLTGIESVHEHFKNHPRTPAYVPSDMEVLYRNPKCDYIIHGHTHTSARWQYDEKSPLVICNPYGNEMDPNQNHAVNPDFNPNFVIKI